MGLAFGAGVILGVRSIESGWLAGAGLALVVALLAISSAGLQRSLCLAVALGCLVGLSAGALRSDGRTESLPSLPAGPLVGAVRGDPDIWRSGAIVPFEWVDGAGVTHSATLFLPPVPEVGRGDTLELTGEIEGAEDELIFAERARVIARAGQPERARRAIRDAIRETLTERLPGSPGALTLGLLIGDDSALTEAERGDLRKAGLSHITAVSGWNVTLVTSAVGLVFLRLGLRGWGWTLLQLVALIAFVWIVGLEPPVARAALMATAALAALRLGRPAHSATVLTLSAAAMVAISPDALASLSFQLSVLATVGLIVAGHLTGGSDGWRAVLVTPIVATGVIGLATAPLLAAEFGTLSLATVPANIVAAPLVPITTIGGLLILVASPIAPLAAALGWLVWALSGGLLALAGVCARIPWAYHEFTPLAPATQAALYTLTLLAAFVALPEGRHALRAASNWSRRDPVGAGATLASATLVALGLAFVV